jgi:hypothetical protein
MRGAKGLDGKRARILVDCTTKGGARFTTGEEGTFHKRGVVACTFDTDDDRTVNVGHWRVENFKLVE